MPKSTFYRLADEKRQRLIVAAYNEFSRAPFADASISNIIKEAGIPRGSFYQYFEDKSDVFFYLLDLIRQSANVWLKDALSANHGDLFATMHEVVERLVETITTGPYHAFYGNLFMYMDFHSADKMAREGTGPVMPPHGPKKGEFASFLLENVDRDRLRVKADDDLRVLIHQLFGMLMQSIGHYFNQLASGAQLSSDELKRRLDQQLDWLQFGVGETKEEKQ
ncbi:TetR family transcriptional regulator [Lacticaseibacillus mingshuiensis]|uniref:TetR family transcriptional regulator n=1 Tax=Lacticaseibacillus mingshuiensis TaxID=2799574 RepID=A0ABW4CLE8_9LACO|nr:TetR family transcriptional regulator [Lacticaseibacillus mingshuiensis]